jgi:hypothetical protein
MATTPGQDNKNVIWSANLHIVPLEGITYRRSKKWKKNRKEKKFWKYKIENTLKIRWQIASLYLIII